MGDASKSLPHAWALAARNFEEATVSADWLLLWRLATQLFAVVWVCTTGCAGYRLGPVNGLAAGEKSVQVMPFINRTLQPRLTDAVTSQMRKELQRDSTYQLSSSVDADIILSGELTGYLRTE